MGVQNVLIGLGMVVYGRSERLGLLVVRMFPVGNFKPSIAPTAQNSVALKFPVLRVLAITNCCVGYGICRKIGRPRSRMVVRNWYLKIRWIICFWSKPEKLWDPK